MSTTASGTQQPAGPVLRGRVWNVGTLTYTTAGLVALFSWLLWGDFAWQMRDRSVPPVIQLLLKSFHASDTLTALLLASLPPALSMLISPIIGYKSDRYRSRWGRRIPFLLIPTPVIVLSMLGLAFSPRIGSLLDHYLGIHSPGPTISVLVVIGVFWTCFEIACITANSVFGGLINDVVPQEVIGRFFGLFRALSLLAGIIFNYWIIGKAETHYAEIFLGVAVLYGFGFSLMCFKVKEGRYPPPPMAEIAEDAPHGFLPAARTYFRECFGKPYYLWFFAMMAVAGLANGPVNVFSVFYAQSINMSIGDYGKCLAITYIISLILAYPVGILTDRFHPIVVSMILLGLYCPLALWAGFFAKDTVTFSVAFVLHGVLTGAYFTAAASMGQRLLPRSRFTELMSANGIVCSLSSVLIAPCIGLILDCTGHVYRHTFFAGAAFALLAVAVTFVTYTKFLALGGPKNYTAPE